MKTAIPSNLRLFHAAFGLTLANVIVMVVNAAIGMVSAHMLSASEYGQVAYFMSIYLMATLVAGFGLTDQVMRDVTKYTSLNQSQQLGQAVYTLLLLRLVTGMVLIAVLGLYALVLHQWTPLIIGFTAALAMLFDFLSGVLRGVQRVGSLIVVLCLQPMVYLALIIALRPTSADQIFVLFCGSFGLVLLLTSCALRGTGIGRPRYTSISRTYIRTSSGGAAQLYSVALLQLAYGSIGILLLGAVGRYAATGIVSVGLMIVRMLPLMLGSAITSVYYPQLRAHLAQHTTEAATHVFKLFYTTTIWIALGGAALLAVFPDTAVHTLYTTKYDQAAPMLQLLAPICVLLVLDLLLTWTLIAHDCAARAIIILIVRIVVLSVCVVLGLWFAPAHLPSAVAIAYVCASAVGAGLQLRAVAQLGYQLLIGRNAVGAWLAVAVMIFCRLALPNFALKGIDYVGNCVVAVAVYAALVAIVFYPAALADRLSFAMHLRLLRVRS